jgi:hypothetical protein
MNYGSSVESQALANKQFSMWNNYNSGGEKLQDIYNKYKDHKQLSTAISIVENLSGLSDVTQGAQFYYANYVKPYWTKDTDTTKWVPTVTIGNHKFGNVVKKKKK